MLRALIFLAFLLTYLWTTASRSMKSKVMKTSWPISSHLELRYECTKRNCENLTVLFSLLMWAKQFIYFSCFDLLDMGKQCRFLDEEDCYLTFAYTEGPDGQLKIFTQKNKGV